jgi:3-oxoacyl-[acyl-carrier protein] reductase
MENLEGKVCIITGAASGIGRACAKLISAMNTRVVLVDINRDAVEQLAGESPAGSDARPLSLCLSISSEADMSHMAEETVARFGRIDMLVACAGILRTGGSLKTVADTPLEEWNKVLDTNLTGTFLSNRAVLPAMMSQKQGDIINISSTSGRQGRPFDSPYCASKAGIIGFSESLAEEVAAYGIRVQTVLPDAVETPLWDQNGPVALKPTHFLSPERVAEFIVYLLTLPRDTYLLNPVIAPVKTRKKKAKPV